MTEQNEELEKQKEHVTEMYEQFAKQVQEMDPKDMQRLQEFLSMYRNKDPRDYMLLRKGKLLTCLLKNWNKNIIWYKAAKAAADVLKET